MINFTPESTIFVSIYEMRLRESGPIPEMYIFAYVNGGRGSSVGRVGDSW